MSELAVATAEATPEDKRTVQSELERYKPDIGQMLSGSGVDVDSFSRAVLSSIRTSSGLQNACLDPIGSGSVWASVLLAAQLRLEIGPALGHFYLTPRQVGSGNERHWECVPIIGYRGYCELARRTGQVEKVETFFVREGDQYETWADSDKGQQFRLNPLPDREGDMRETPPWTHVIAVVKMMGAGTVWEALTRAQVDARRPNFRTPVWDKHYDQMARKTAVRALSPYMPMSNRDFGVALQADGNRVDREGDELVVTEVEDSD